MHNHPISHFVLPHSDIVFLHWKRIDIINKINGNVWLMIDILPVSPHVKFEPVIDPFFFFFFLIGIHSMQG